MPAKKSDRQYFHVLLKVNFWAAYISHCADREKWRGKDWPEPTVLESFTADCEVLYSDCPKLPVGHKTEFVFSTDFNYMVYNQRKAFRFVDDKRPDDRWADISYDEYMKRSEEKSRKTVGSFIQKNMAVITAPIELSNRIAVLFDKYSHITATVFTEKGSRTIFIHNVSLDSNVNIEDWTG